MNSGRSFFTSRFGDVVVDNAAVETGNVMLYRILFQAPARAVKQSPAPVLLLLHRINRLGPNGFWH